MSLLTTIKVLLGSAWHVNSDNALGQLLPTTDGVVEAGKAIVPDANKAVDTLDHTTLKIGGVAVTATAAEINSAVHDAGRYVAGGATISLTAANNKQTVKMDTLAGTAITLPAATGTGNKFKALVTVLATSNSHKISAAGTDVMIGMIFGTRVDSGNAVLGFAAQSTSNTITLNRTTTGSVTLGEWVELEDVAAGVWEVTGMLSATGAAFATPFSHV